MTSVFVQSDTPNQWLPAQDWQVGLLTGTAFIGSGKNKSNQYLAIPHEAQALFGDALPQLSSNVVTNLSESLDKAIKLLSEISARFSDPRPVTGDHTVRFKPVTGTVFGSSAPPLSISDTTLALPAPSVPALPAPPVDSTPVVDSTVPSVPSLPVDSVPAVDPVPMTVPAQDGGCSAAASVVADSTAPVADSVPVPTTVPAQDNALVVADSTPSSVPVPTTDSTVTTLVPVTVTTVPPSVPQGITVNVPLPSVLPAATPSPLLTKFFASAPVAPPAPPTMTSIKPLVQPFLAASNDISAANIATFEPRFGEVLTRLAQVLFQTRHVLQSDEDYKLWKQLADTFFKLRQVGSDRKRSGVLCNLRTGTSRLYLITSLSNVEVNKRYTHSKPFMLEPASLNMLKRFA